MKYFVKWKTNDFHGLEGYYVSKHNWTKDKEKAKRFFKPFALLKAWKLNKEDRYGDKYFIEHE